MPSDEQQSNEGTKIRSKNAGLESGACSIEAGRNPGLAGLGQHHSPAAPGLDSAGERWASQMRRALPSGNRKSQMALRHVQPAMLHPNRGRSDQSGTVGQVQFFLQMLAIGFDGLGYRRRTGVKGVPEFCSRVLLR